MCHRLANDVGAADHHRFQAGERGVHGLGEQDAAERRARHQRWQSARQPPDIGVMKPVDVLGRIDCGDHLLSVDVFRQRQLHENAVHRQISIEPRDQGEQLFLRGRCRQLVVVGIHARCRDHLRFGADIDIAGRVVADQHDRDARHDAAIALESAHRVGDLAAQVCRDGFAVDDVRRYCPRPAFQGLKVLSSYK